MDSLISAAIFWVTIALICLSLLAYGLGMALSTVITLIGAGFVILLGLALVGMVKG